MFLLVFLLVFRGGAVLARCRRCRLGRLSQGQFPLLTGLFEQELVGEQGGHRQNDGDDEIALVHGSARWSSV
ncbi:MAG: hypothetical protein U1E97_09760 [Alphaproteobacteria bacterium]